MVKELKKEVTVFEAKDQTLFRTKSEAEEYDNLLEKLQRMHLYSVSYAPDLTEGRGLTKSMYVISNDELSIRQYLYNKFGSPMSLVQGLEPIPTYLYTRKELAVPIYISSKTIKTSNGYKDKENKEPIISIDRLGVELDDDNSVITKYFKLKDKQLNI